jgi:hypothetical protein
LASKQLLVKIGIAETAFLICHDVFYLLTYNRYFSLNESSVNKLLILMLLGFRAAFINLLGKVSAFQADKAGFVGFAS